MQAVSEPIDYIPNVLNFSPMRLTDEQFESLARNHPDLNLELSAEGELIIVAPTLPDTGWKNNELSFLLTSWAKGDGRGMVFDSSTLFSFPNGAKRSPDAAWLKREKWDALPPSEKKKFSKLVPDFVAELRSQSDSLGTLKAKMAEYIGNGVRLAWLVDPLQKQVSIYRANGEVEVLDDPESVSGEDVLPGFELHPRELW
jgi:Uma2 family endonuclease